MAVVVATLEPDETKAQLSLVPEIEIEAREQKTLSLTKYNLIDLWESGVLSDKAYIYLALRMENYSGDLSIEMFISRWRGVSDKPKELKPKTVISAIAALEDAEVLKTQVYQIPLRLF